MLTRHNNGKGADEGIPIDAGHRKLLEGVAEDLGVKVPWESSGVE